MPSLLSAPLSEAQAASAIFEREQLLFLVREGEMLLARLRQKGHTDDDHARKCLALLQARLEQYEPEF